MKLSSCIARAAFVLLTASISTASWAAPCGGFTDVDDTDPLTAPFCANVAWVKNRGITLGCTSATLFCPHLNVSRLQMAAFMSRLGDVTFQKGGNAFAETAVIGTTDQHTLSIRVGNKDAVSIVPTNFVPNIVVGSNSCSTFGVDRVPTVGANVGGAVIAGGGAPTANVNGCGGGDFHKVWDHNGTISGGFGNTAGNGNLDLSDAAFAAVGGGVFNSATAYAAGVASGDANQASGARSFVGGGFGNIASGDMATVPGGLFNEAGGARSLAAGRRAKAQADGSMAFGDNTDVDLVNATANSFVIGFAGGIGMFTNKSQATGCAIAAGGGTWVCSSSRAEKSDIAPVDPRDVLERVNRLPVSTWRYRSEVSGAMHLGPMAQDFYAAFGLGDSDRSIGLIDASGVALAAIQGLSAKLEAALDAKSAQIATLEARLEELRLAHARELAELRRATDILLARTSPEGRLAHAP